MPPSYAVAIPDKSREYGLVRMLRHPLESTAMIRSRSQLGYLLGLLRDAHHRPYIRRWLASLRSDYLMTAAIPWIPFAAIDHLDSVDLSNARVFEFGSGGSTLYWLRRGANCVSVEHDPTWSTIVQQRTQSLQATHLHRPPEPAAPAQAGDDADPDAYRSSGPEFTKLTFKSYCSAINAYPAGHFDVVLIDGRARPSCIKHARDKVRAGGLLILDNSDRPHYTLRTANLLTSYTAKTFHGVGPFSSTLWSCTFYTRRAVCNTVHKAVNDCRQ